MKIALIGYGKMGHIIERIALERGHEIVSKVDVDNQEEFNSEAFASADVAIEFTIPTKAIENYRKAWAVGVPVVSGTTGWNAVLPELKKE
ncbi:MAG: 4-hydroxy-tetrahydrodipicolinate reductase, partial [Paludibacteraceae bacterium]|nr:4-hydroxy-tetrahydrodipicolinate reductase [Paludibacteraceae bacterium]